MRQGGLLQVLEDTTIITGVLVPNPLPEIPMGGHRHPKISMDLPPGVVGEIAIIQEVEILTIPALATLTIRGHRGALGDQPGAQLRR